MNLPERNDWLVDDEETTPARTPSYVLSDDEVEATEWEYPDRAPGDWVISGPLGSEGTGRGRWFANWRQAEKWAREKYGFRFKRRVPEAAQYGASWAFLVGPMGD